MKALAQFVSRPRVVYVFALWSLMVQPLPHCSFAGAAEPPAKAETASAQHQLGKSYLDKGDAVDAQSWFEKSLETASKPGAANEELVADIHEALAMAMFKQGDYEPAEQELRKALSLRVHDPHVPPWETDYCRNQLAKVLAAMGRTDEAIDLYQKSVAGLSKFAVDSEAKAAAFSDAANCLYEHKRYKEAGELFQRSLKIRRSLLAVGDLRIAENARDAATCLYQQMLYDEALPLYQETVRVREKNAGSDRSIAEKKAIADANIDLGDCYAKLKRFDEAAASYQAAKDIKSKLEGIEESETEALQDKCNQLDKQSGRSAGVLFGQAMTNPLFWIGVIGVPLFALGVIGSIIMLIGKSMHPRR